MSGDFGRRTSHLVLTRSMTPAAETSCGACAAMNTPGHTATASFKEKAIEEFKLFWVIALYLGVMLGAFAWYRRFVLSEAGINYFHYGASVISALILAKVILIGQALRLGRQFEASHLILSVLFKSAVFAVFVGVFALLEHLVEGLVHRESWDQIAHGLVRAGEGEIFARTVVALVTLIPFFAFWETDRVLGDHKLFNLFFHKRA
jgi:hypothetical protein